MDPILSTVYSTILPSAPFVIAAYAIIWVAVFIFVLIILRGMRKNTRDIAALEEAMERLEKGRTDRS